MSCHTLSAIRYLPYTNKGWVLLADVEPPASKTGVVAARVDAFLIFRPFLSPSLYTAAIGLTPLSALLSLSQGLHVPQVGLYGRERCAPLHRGY